MTVPKEHTRIKQEKNSATYAPTKRLLHNRGLGMLLTVKVSMPGRAHDYVFVRCYLDSLIGWQKTCFITDALSRCYFKYSTYLRNIRKGWSLDRSNPVSVETKEPFTWKEGDPLRRGTLLEGSPFSIVFPGFVYMIGRVTLGGGLPYLLARVTLLAGTTFCLLKPCKRLR